MFNEHFVWPNTWCFKKLEKKYSTKNHNLGGAFFCFPIARDPGSPSENGNGA